MFGIESSDVWPALLGIAAVAAGAAAIISVWLTIRSERRRTQPIVLASERLQRTGLRLLDNGCWGLTVQLGNEGVGSAFNLRWGVLIDGCRVPHRQGTRTEGPPARMAVLRAGQEAPSDPAKGYAVNLTGEQFRALSESGKAKYAVWCRYENSFGQTWETVNSIEPQLNMEIRHIRSTRVKERLEARALSKLDRHAARKVKDAAASS